MGQVPAMDEEAAIAGLNAAVRAWDHGRGSWPTMSVAARVAAVEAFAAEMSKVRDELVNLLMWEIGKSFDDSIKEFDRTLQYSVNGLVDRLRNSTARTPGSVSMVG
jgi:glyceraldehyde-3-phosphate dehydrogenase (NADP+)